ncbi:MAG TPA: MFS transporter [Actinoplanes sp.]|nr:MFS transporter [Actinoplanes sp.]
MMSINTGTRWGTVVSVYLGGVLAASGLGQVAAVLPLMQNGLGVSLAAMGWAVSVITVTSAVAGVAGGVWVQRLGARRALLAGLATMAVAAAGGALTDHYGTLLATRVVAGVGYLLVVVSGPALLVRHTHERNRTTALAVWSTFVPIGIALSSFVGGLIGPGIGWPAWFLVCAAATAAVAVLVAVAVPAGARQTAETGTTEKATPGRWLTRPVLLALGFCAVSSISVALSVLLPAFLIEQRELPLWTAGTINAVVSLVSVPGSLLAGWLLRRGVGYAWLALGSVVLPAAALFAFSSASWPVNAVAAGVMSLVNGVLIAGVFAVVPVLAGDGRRMDLVNGLITQFGSIGALLGPPVLTRTASWGWEIVPLVVAVIVLPGGALVWAAVRRPRRPRPAPAPALAEER